jgi:hypothetical protein
MSVQNSINSVISSLQKELNVINGDTIAIGTDAAKSSQGSECIAIGNNAGTTGQKDNAVAIGPYAGNTSQGYRSVALGQFSGQISQGSDCVAIGSESGKLNQSYRAISIGAKAGETSQGIRSIAIGSWAGQSNQIDDAISIGTQAGQTSQQTFAVAIGYLSGTTSQQTNCVAIGKGAGNGSQGSNAIAIGFNAGYSNQRANSIIINAGSDALNNTTESGLFINPIRNVTDNTLNPLCYDTNTKEITRNTGKTFVINHPIDENKYLVHACLEGPEAGIYYRGKGIITNNESVKITLPEYVKYIGKNYTINITKIYSGIKSNETYETSEIEDNSFTVFGSNGSFYWIVYGERQKIDIEPYKNDVKLKGDGPYTYLFK